MLTALRAQVNAALAVVPARRRPTLRRCDAPDALLATDLPFIADEPAVAAFAADMQGKGWRVTSQNGWILLDAPIPAPEAPIPANFAGEAGCCISLLLRHPGSAEAAELIRAVAKAAEAGPLPFERLCTQIHADFAARLRKKAPLPGALLPYLCAAYHRFDP